MTSQVLPCNVSDADIACTAQSLKALSHPLRIKILCSLGRGELSVHEIVDRVGTTQSNVSQHLKRLHDEHLVSTRHQANVACYRLREPKLLSLIEMVRRINAARKWP